jgi:hypothetical protein
MALCSKEAEYYKRGNRHHELVTLPGTQIDRLAKELGFNDGQIGRREFRALKEDGHVVPLLTRSEVPPVELDFRDELRLRLRPWSPVIRGSSASTTAPSFKSRSRWNAA